MVPAIIRQTAKPLGTDMSQASLYQVIEKTIHDPLQALLYHYASQAWNLDFFLHSIKPVSSNIPGRIAERIEGEFGTVSQMMAEFKQNALGVLGCGWTWLVHQCNPTSREAQLRIVNTFNGASPLFPRAAAAGFRGATLFPKLLDTNTSNAGKRSSTFRPHISQLPGMFDKSTDTRQAHEMSMFAGPAPPCASVINSGTVTPLLAISLWEHAYLLDYGVQRDQYIDRFWKVVNWSRVAVLMNLDEH